MPELWTGNWDWPQNNIKFFRHREDGKFRWVLYDLENGFGDLEFNHFTNSEYGFNGYKTADGHTTKLMQGLLKQPEFQALLIDNMSICLGSIFNPDRFDHLADSIYALIADELPYNRDRWGTTYNAAGYVEDFKNFNRQRPAYLRDDFREQFALGTDVPFTVRSTHSAAVLTFNSIPLPLGYMDGYTYQGREVTLSATAPAGYQFVGWNTMSGSERSVMPQGSAWRYYDMGSLDGDNWMSASYDDSYWQQGKAPLGYAKEGIETIVSYGDNANAKYPTTYFRTTFTMPDYNPTGRYFINLHVDDGAIVYINGKEAFRHLMPSGSVTFYDYATAHASGNPDRLVVEIPASLLRKGKNTLAIEVHQNSATSSDVYMDLSVTTTVAAKDMLVTDNPYTFVANSPVEMVACFEPVGEEQMTIPPVRINEVCLSNATYVNEYFQRNDWIELYNTTDEPQSIAGLYVTNDLSNPRYYRIPDEGELSVIPPHGYRILWADKLMSFAELHLPFKLSSTGEALMLSCYDNQGNLVWSDSLYVGEIGKNVSYGRYPNGADDLYVMNRMTFSDANFYSPYNIPMRFTADDVSVETMETHSVLPQISYASQRVTVNLPYEYELPQELLVYDLQGRVVQRHTLTNAVETLSVETLPEGVYIVKVAGDTQLKIHN